MKHASKKSYAGLPNATSLSNVLERLLTEQIKLHVVVSEARVEGIDAQRAVLAGIHDLLMESLSTVLLGNYQGIPEFRTFRFAAEDLRRAEDLLVLVPHDPALKLVYQVYRSRAANEGRSKAKNDIETIMQWVSDSFRPQASGEVQGFVAGIQEWAAAFIDVAVPVVKKGAIISQILTSTPQIGIRGRLEEKTYSILGPRANELAEALERLLLLDLILGDADTEKIRLATQLLSNYRKE